MDSREEKNYQDKTEEATEEKRSQFREEGNIVNPKDLVSCVTLIIFTIYFYFSINNILKSFHLIFDRSWNGFPPNQFDQNSLYKIIYYVISPMVPHLLFIIFVCSIFPTLFGLLITKFNWSWKKINIDLNRINPINGMTKMYSLNFLIEIIKIIIKFSFIFFTISIILKNEIFNIDKNYFFYNIDFTKNLGKSIFNLLFIMCIVGLFIGLGDFIYNYYKINNEMKMTKQELKEEVKKHEGDPLLKAQRKRLARDLVMRKSLREVPKATFILTNPEHFSVAIRYRKGMHAPIVVAKGQDLIAFKIREIAKQHDIVIVENKPLARTLYKTVKTGQEIPSSLYHSIIEVIRYIYQLRGKNYFERF